ncbi:hypothetical protein [Altererythrobacter lutimaris]|uniref:Uncharacterized protein n=1 Tax=Altererythrobacter lutimaris TaxID=2743979 RepID=A0A850H782_9SPHN|nr:hypothetical protein [Altererythrobacter lutimaris]NVE95027.1 hypothetical protein [Altererythrobacter lutimaris]
MKKLGLTIVAGALALASGTAHAQSFTYEVTWEPVESYGGLMGPDGMQYRGGSVDGTYVTTFADGSTSTGTMKCAGTGQPDGGIFAIHIACTATASDGGTAQIAYGCNYVGEPGPETPLGCVAGIQGKDDEGAYVNGSATMYWYSDTSATGTGQWYTN